MRFYIHASPFTGKKRLVIDSNILLAHNKRSRGAALGWVILHRVPKIESHYTGDNIAWVYSESGGKKLSHVLNHEQWHCDSQTKDGIIGFIKWMYKYKTNKTFQDEEERLAREAEHVPVASSVPRF